MQSKNIFLNLTTLNLLVIFKSKVFLWEVGIFYESIIISCKIVTAI